MNSSNCCLQAWTLATSSLSTLSWCSLKYLISLSPSLTFIYSSFSLLVPSYYLDFSFSASLTRLDLASSISMSSDSDTYCLWLGFYQRWPVAHFKQVMRVWMSSITNCILKCFSLFERKASILLREIKRLKWSSIEASYYERFLNSPLSTFWTNFLKFTL